MTNRKNWKLGASSCILGGYKNHTSEGFGKYREANIKYAELSLPIWDESFDAIDFYEHPEKIKEIAEREGVTFATFHAPFSHEVSLSIPEKEGREYSHRIFEKTIGSAAKIGINKIVLHPTSAYDECYPDRQFYLEQTTEEVFKVNEFCKKLGVELAVENMKPDHITCRSSEMIYLLRNIPDLKMCLDTNHSLIEKTEDYLGALLKSGMKGRIIATHISDCELEVEQHRLPGEGKINWEGVITKLEELDFDGVFMYEVSKSDIGRYSLCDIAENFKKLIK